MKNKIFITLLLLSMFLQQANSQVTINKKDLRKHIEFLASDKLKGRKSGEEGNNKAANYIRNEFKDMHLDLMGEKGFQYFDIVTKITVGKGNYLKIGKFHAKMQEDNMPFSFSGNGKLKSKVVFVGYGFDIKTKKIQWNDYKNVKVKGKWVLILRGDPEMDNRKSDFIPYSSDRSKVLTAIDKGAAGVIFVSGVSFDKKDKLEELKVGRGNAQTKIPVIQVKRQLANKVLQNQKIEELEKALIKEHKSKSFKTNTVVDANVNIKYVKARTQNVVAMIPGFDPKLKDKYIVIGAHFDHLGMGGKDSGSRMPDTIAVHNGADDNASGVASLLEIAQEFSNRKMRTKRSIIFIAFSGEEIGLLGSSYFVNNPLVDISKIYAMINLDMVGRLNSKKVLTVAGTGTAKEFEPFLTKFQEQIDKRYKKLINEYGNAKGKKKFVAEKPIKMTFLSGGFGASDHSSFYMKKIPVLFFNTGAHKDYHTPFDDVEFINFEGQQEVTRLIFTIADELQQSKEILTYQQTGSGNTGRKYGRGFKVTLGIMPGYGDNTNNGLRVDGVSKNRPAEIGGMKAGDVIVAINGLKITNIYDYMERLRKLTPGQMATVDVMRKGKKVVLQIKL